MGQDCGLDIKVYTMKKYPGLGSLYWEFPKERALVLTFKGGPMEVQMGIMAHNNPIIIGKNNGAAAYLTVNPACGLADWIICGKAFVVRDDGRYPLSRGQVWGIQEMVNCAMKIYDMAGSRKHSTRSRDITAMGDTISNPILDPIFWLGWG